MNRFSHLDYQRVDRASSERMRNEPHPDSPETIEAIERSARHAIGCVPADLHDNELAMIARTVAHHAQIRAAQLRGAS